MIARLLRRIGKALYIPVPMWLSNYAAGSLDREIAAMEAERVAEMARDRPRLKHLGEIEKGLVELREMRSEFP